MLEAAGVEPKSLKISVRISVLGIHKKRCLLEPREYHQYCFFETAKELRYTSFPVNFGGRFSRKAVVPSF